MRALGAVCVALPLLAALGCQPSARGGTASRLPQAAPGSAQLELRQAEERPPIGLVAREGDPASAVAFGVAHDFGAEASVGLGALLAGRLRAAGFPDVRARVHGLGFVLTTLVASEGEAARFVDNATRAFAAPVTAGELSAARAPNRIPSFRSASAAAVGSCSGELGAASTGPTSVSLEPPDARALEEWRARARSSLTTAFAAAGPRAVLDAAARALANGPAWPTESAATDRWPDADVLGTAPGSERRVAVAYRFGDGARAAELAQALGKSGSRLASRLAGLEPGWALDRTVATTRPRGACLRIDVRATRSEPAPTLLEVARVVAVVEEEARPPLGRAGGGFALDEAAVRPTDPRDAAASAAWRALSGRFPSGPARRFVSYSAPTNELKSRADEDVARAVSRVQTAFKQSTVVRRTRVEAGQGEVWALVGSSCGTSAEGTDDAGANALLMRVLAAHRSRSQGVTLEAWATPEGVGLLAHAPRSSASESPEAQAARIGDALGRALALPAPSDGDVADERTALLEEIGPAERRGFWLALEAASGGHPSWLDPRGTWASVSALSPHELDAVRRAMLSGPLRLAVLANASESQAVSLSRALEGWLRPSRVETGACPVSPRKPPPTGELTVDVANLEGSRSYVAVPLSGEVGARADVARLTLHLLNRPGGLLDTALAAHPGSGARAALLGGRAAGALLVEVRVEQGDAAPVVAAVRRALGELARGSATEAELATARKQVAALDAEAALDPRHRLLELWQPAAARSVDLATFRRFHQAFAPERHLLVSAKPRK